MTKYQVAREMTVQSPYTRSSMTAFQLGLPSDAAGSEAIDVELFERPVSSLREAAAVYAKFGAVILSGETKFKSIGTDSTVEGLVGPVRELVLRKLETPPWRITENPIRTKRYDAYNGTGRSMGTVAYDNVRTYFPEIINLQRRLLPLVRGINKDPTTTISTDVAEGTVMNLQMFNLDGDLDAVQQHGAHTDRVDTTAVVCLENVGEQGDLVFIDGYTTACGQNGLDPHRNYDNNIAKLMVLGLISFRVHPVRPGGIVLLSTDKEVHYITTKTAANVTAGLEASNSQGIVLPEGNVLGRGIINMAFETKACREIDNISRRLEANAALCGLRGDEFFKKAHVTLQSSRLDDETRRKVMTAMVTRLSAEDLYG